MSRYSTAALAAVVLLSACGAPGITSRLDTSDTHFAAFEPVDRYTPQPVGARAENDFMRFSTMSLVR